MCTSPRSIPNSGLINVPAPFLRITERTALGLTELWGIKGERGEGREGGRGGGGNIDV